MNVFIFLRGSDAEIYQERKLLGKLIVPEVLKQVDYDIKNTVFSYIPNTAETSFFGMIETVEEYLNKKKTEQILKGTRSLSAEKVTRFFRNTHESKKLRLKMSNLERLLQKIAVVMIWLLTYMTLLMVLLNQKTTL